VDLTSNLGLICSTLERWALAGGRKLRSYQLEAGQAICEAALKGLGGSFAVMFPRQSGKNELQAWIESYLLFLRSVDGADLVKISPTWKPQSLNAMNRLEKVLAAHPLTRHCWTRESGYIYRIGRARISFFSGQRESNIVGATASLLLEIDEAQDIDLAKYDKEIGPMAASTNAVRVFWGTAWTDTTLLFRELQLAKQDNQRRVWRIDARRVRTEVEEYGIYVAEQVQRLGRMHPLIRSQYFSEEITQELSLFTPARRILMQGSHPWLDHPLPGEQYALLVDVGGEFSRQDQPLVSAQHDSEPLRDATALTIVRVSLPDAIVGPVFEVVHRSSWTGEAHPVIYSRIKALVELWDSRYIVVDATGMGESLAGFLERALPGRVVRFVFTAKSKSDLGWSWLAAIETGRYKEYLPADHPEAIVMSRLFWRQVDHCEATPSGAGALLRWGVPAGRRDEAGYIHDDLLISSALCTTLEGFYWGNAVSVVIPPKFDDVGWGK
jgi:hypothetical protein